jgi:hypothetical protein
MSHHELKECERCKTPFECKPANIAACECSGVQLSEHERTFIRTLYADCLCSNCLNQLKQEFYTQQLHAKIRHTPLG